MALPMTDATRREYESYTKKDNYIWHQYRVLGEKPKRDAVGNFNYNTPRQRTAATQAPVRQGIALGTANYVPEVANRPPPSNPDAETQRRRNQALRSSRHGFEIPPR